MDSFAAFIYSTAGSTLKIHNAGEPGEKDPFYRKRNVILVILRDYPLCAIQNSVTGYS